MDAFTVHSRFALLDYDLRFPEDAFPQRFPAFRHPNGSTVGVGKTPEGEALCIVESQHADPDLLVWLGGGQDEATSRADGEAMSLRAHGIRREHRAVAEDVVGVLRWMTLRSAHQAKLGGRLRTMWSKGNGEWQPFPGLGPPSFTDSHWGTFDFDQARQQWVQMAIDAGDREPLAHILWREAREQLVASPRSALVIGVAALEIGVTQHLRRMGRTVRSRRGGPGVLELLIGVVPQLDPPRWVDPPGWVRRRLGQGIAARNRVAHDGDEAPSRQELVRFLRSVRDILLLLDYQWGKEWAMAYIDFPHGLGVSLVGLEASLEAPFPDD